MKSLTIFVYAYITLPIIIFLSTWIKPAIGIPLTVLVLFSLLLVFRKSPVLFDFNFKENWRCLLIAFVVIAVWVCFSGVQKTVYQNSDSYIRNGILEVLVKNEWPVFIENDNQTVMLIYYIGFWLPSALVGKIFGVEAAYFCLYLWTLLGVFITYLLICNLMKRVRLWPLLLFIFFSGLDIVGMLIKLAYKSDFIDGLSLITHLEWWNRWQLSSFTTQLFWVFNQAVPAWVATLLVLNQKNNGNIVFILGSLFLSSTFPLVGLIPIAVYVSVRNIVYSEKKTFQEYVRSMLTYENIIGGGITGIISFLYLKGNYSSQSIAVSLEDNSSFAKTIILYALFVFLEFFLFYMVIFRYQKKNPLYYVTFVWLCLCPLIKVGYSVDFCMRASIPSLVVLYLLVASSLESMKKEKSWLLFFLMGLLALGAVTPLFEINRTIYNTAESLTHGENPSNGVASEAEIVTPGNFGGVVDSRLQHMLFDID